MTEHYKPERYWGIITFSVAWVMGTLILNAVAGTQGAGNVITVLWLWVAYLAFRGKAQAIATVAKFVMIFQVVVGGIFFIVLLNDPGMQIYLGPPELFLFGLAIPLVAWVILYSWSSSIAEATARKSVNNLKPPADTHVHRNLQQSRSVPQQGKNSDSVLKANKTEGVNIKQGTEIRRATPTENNSNAQIPIAPEAEIILEYVEEARFQLEKLKLHPEAVRTKYMELVIESGGADPEKSFREAVVWGLGGGIEYDTNLEESFQTLSTIGAPALEEFYRVVPTLKKTMPLMKIMEAVSKRFEETEPELVIVNGSYGTQRKAYRHLSGQWSIISNRGVRRYFSTLDELYDFLATPQSAREKPKNDKDIPKKEGILVTPDFNLMIKEHRVFNVNDKRITIYEFDDGSFVTENSEGKWASFDSLESARR